jgi:hypothetical protein
MIHQSTTESITCIRFYSIQCTQHRVGAFVFCVFLCGQSDQLSARAMCGCGASESELNQLQLVQIYLRLPMGHV